MRKHFILASTLFAISLCLLPAMVFASKTGVPFGGDALNSHTDSVIAFLFGPISRIAAVFGGAYGLAVGLIQGSFAKIIPFGGLLLTSIALPGFINGIYSVLLP